MVQPRWRPMTTDWNPLLRGEFDKPYWQELQAFVRSEIVRWRDVVERSGASVD